MVRVVSQRLTGWEVHFMDTLDTLDTLDAIATGKTSVQLDDITRKPLVRRLKIIEGPALGIRRMLEEGRACEEILTEFSALQAASHAVRMLTACAPLRPAC